jgi:Peptidase M50B-like
VRERVASLLWPIALAVACYAAWSTPFVFPLKIFVVFLHELSHGLAAILTGGTIERIELSANEGGLCVTRGGWGFVVTSAGYLGSLLLGAGLLVAGGRARPSAQRAIIAFTGVTVLVVTLLFVRTLFGFAWGLATGFVLVAVARYFGAGVSVFLLRLLGVTSCLYAIWDIVSDLVLRSPHESDANALARMTGIPGIVWGVLWCCASVVVAIAAYRAAVRSDSLPARA